MTGREVIEVDQYLPHPPMKVWRALTDPELLARWLMPGDFKPEVGHRFTLDAGRHGLARCEVLDVDPDHLIRFSWRNGDLDTTVTWRLQREGSGTRLFVVHAGFDPGQPAERTAFEAMRAGWQGPIVQALAEVLDGLPAGAG